MKSCAIVVTVELLVVNVFVFHRNCVKLLVKVLMSNSNCVIITGEYPCQSNFMVIIGEGFILTIFLLLVDGIFFHRNFVTTIGEYIYVPQ